MQNTKKWAINEKGIIKSLEAVMKSGDINNLTKDAYNFTMSMSGFIAHYNHGGFMDYYRNNVADLIKDLENSSDIPQANRYINDDYFGKHKQHEYYASKARILIAIGEMIPKYKNKIQKSEEGMINNGWNLLTEITKREYTTAEKKKLLIKFNIL